MYLPGFAGAKVNGLYRASRGASGTWPTVTPPSTDYRAYGSVLYDDPAVIPPDNATSRGTVIADQFGTPFQVAPRGEPWTTHDAGVQMLLPSASLWEHGPHPFRTDWVAGNALSLRFQVARKAGTAVDTFSNVGVETRDAQVWAKVGGVWQVLDQDRLSEGGYGRVGQATVQAAPTTVAPGHQRWAAPLDQRTLNAWNIGWPRPTIPTGTTALFARMWMRLVGTPGTARPFMGLLTLDAYTANTAAATTGAPWVATRFKTITPHWQPWAAVTLPLPPPAAVAVGTDFWSTIRAEQLPNTVPVGGTW